MSDSDDSGNPGDPGNPDTLDNLDTVDTGEPGELDADSVVAVELGDVVDLHGFAPRDLPELVQAALDQATERGLRHLRLIHGRGIGVHREIVRSLLARDRRVAAFTDAPGEAGGWGATCVTLR